MSLTKQLWIGIILILLAALGGSFFISTLSARAYLQEQLQLKNIDNAVSLALSMSQMEKDPVTLELLLAAQFDSGHYQYIRLTNPQGEVIAERQFNSESHRTEVPAWFSSLLSIEVAPGNAKVQDGWQQYGTIELQSHSRYAIQTLWQSTLQLLKWFLIAALVAGFLGTLILKTITRPLRSVIQQAEAIGQRLFITSNEPKTREFRRLVHAMNRLSASVKTMLDQETRKLEQLQITAQRDSVTGLANREHFLNMLAVSLTREDSATTASICMLRLRHLSALNTQKGHQGADKFLQELAGIINSFVALHDNNYAGRLNGTDFCLVSFNQATVSGTAHNLSEQVQRLIRSTEIHSPLFGAVIAGSYYHAGESHRQILGTLDDALATAEQKGNYAIIIKEESAPVGLQRNLEQWRECLHKAIADNQLKLASFAVRDREGEMLHTEKPVRMHIDGNWRPAGYFTGWANRLQLMDKIDLLVLQQALADVWQQGEPVAINLSESSLCSVEFRQQTLHLLAQRPAENSKLWIEFPETCAVRFLPLLREFCHNLRDLNCRLGLEHVGAEFTHIRELQDIGLHYLKIDGSLTRHIDSQSHNHEIVRGLCTIGHSLGMTMIAEGVTTEEEKSSLLKLGMDGLTGPGIQ